MIPSTDEERSKPSPLRRMPNVPEVSEMLSVLDAIEQRLTLDKRHVYRLDKRHIPGVTTAIDQWRRRALEDWKVRVQQDADIAVAYKLFCEPFTEARPSFGEFSEAFKLAAGDEYEHQRQSREAADLGGQVHALIEERVKRRLGIEFAIGRPISDEAQALFSSWVEWEARVGFEPLFVERRVYHEDHWYAGTIDLGARVQDPEPMNTVMDWKTKKAGARIAFWESQALQNFAYRRALQRMGLGEWAGHIVIIPKDGRAVEALRCEPGEGDKWTADGAFSAFLACLTLYRNERAFNG